MVDNIIPYILFGFSAGMLIATYLYSKVIDRIIIRHYDSQKALINKFYTELQEQTDAVFSYMKSYLKKEDAHD